MTRSMGNSNRLKDYVTCEANGCNARAMFKIMLKVGTYHSIQLFLYRTFKPKFCSNGVDVVGAEDDTD